MPDVQRSQTGGANPRNIKQDPDALRAACWKSFWQSRHAVVLGMGRSDLGPGLNSKYSSSVEFTSPSSFIVGGEDGVPEKLTDAEVLRAILRLR